jgi:hypothetical protein
VGEVVAEAEEEEEEIRARIEAVPGEEGEVIAIADRDEDRRRQKVLQLHPPKRPLQLQTRRTRRWQRLLPSCKPTTTMTMATSASSAPTPSPTTRLRRATTRHAISAACA